MNEGIKSYQGEDCEFTQMSCFRRGYFACRKGQNAASVKELGGPFGSPDIKPPVSRKPEKATHFIYDFS